MLSIFFTDNACAAMCHMTVTRERHQRSMCASTCSPGFQTTYVFYVSACVPSLTSQYQSYPNYHAGMQAHAGTMDSITST